MKRTKSRRSKASILRVIRYNQQEVDRAKHKEIISDLTKKLFHSYLQLTPCAHSYLSIGYISPIDIFKMSRIKHKK